MRIYNLKKDVIDERDLKFSIHEAGIKVEKLPDVVDNSHLYPYPVIDQGSLGQCASCSARELFEFVAKQKGYTIPERSSIFHYYNSRLDQGDINDDTGQSIRESIKSLAKYGICSAKNWPNDTSKFTEKPSVEAYSEARGYKAIMYKRVPQDEVHIKTALYHKMPITLGIQVYESFESEEVARTGIVPLPKSGEELLGGHGINLHSYDKEYGICRNSWSEKWGDKGNFRLPWKFILDPNFTSDLWTVTDITVK